MTSNKTTETNNSVTAFLNKVADETKRNDCLKLAALISKKTGLPAKMWGPAIVGFGSYHYVNDSGREGDAPLVGFSPRANAIVLYLSADFKGRATQLKKFGKHTTGKGCIYIKKLEDVDTDVMLSMVAASVAHISKKYPG